MRKIIDKSILFIIVLIMLIIGYKVFVNLGENLVLNENPKQSDVIVVLSGEVGRLQEGVNLFHDRYGDYVLLSNSTVQYTSTSEAIALGIPENRIIEEDKATSTYTNAVYAKQLIQQNNYHSAIIVSSDFHMKRTKLIFERVFNDTEIKLTYVSSNTPWFSKDQWWKDKFSRRIVINEWIRIVGYQFYLYKWIDVE
jgi:uncharacterized SAM-binding protein YcdF (DUF218 family)